ncbi:MAG: CpsD/CapB family tyrosine-protein kinase [Chloroflexi bacterium]|nr:CpsD/CapB family tyrosine-protein kinase [Chloroflexota bacterium]
MRRTPRVGNGSLTESAPGNGLVAASSPRSQAAEAYRTLRTNIQFSSLDRDIRTLLVTSPDANEGKTTILANLAIMFTESGRRVIVVDCDLRRPRLHALFELRESPGMTTMVLDENAEAPLQATMIPHLWVLASGPLPPNPSELLASERMVRIIARLADQADMVLFDSPPVGVVSDAAVLATRVDGVLLVVDAGRTRRDLARQAKEQLDRVGARLLGTVLNNVKPERRAYDYHEGGR